VSKQIFGRIALMLKILSKYFDINQQELNRLGRIVEKINDSKPKFKKLKDKDFLAETRGFRERLSKGESLEMILPEAYGTMFEVVRRTIGHSTHDVQLMAAVALFEGKVAEQKTGEGKTLSAVYPLYLRALTGKGSHLVTVNDYLAQRDAGWNGPAFQMMGLSTSAIIGEQKSLIFDTSFSDKSHGDERLEHLKPCGRKEAYSADITYGTNNEFGFDYLRDNMVGSLSEMAQREHYFAIVDEVDSILIDEARTPLIISAPDTEPTEKYYKFSGMVDKLNSDTDYTIDEKSRTANLTEHGILKVEKILGVDNLYEKDFDSIHHIENALRSRALYLKDQNYVVKDGQVVIVDEFTGRLMPGRRWSDGLHQAVEAKEGVVIQRESKTLATISFQNYFRMYEVLSGMTATATTEAEEFKKIYKLETVAIPTDKPVARDDKSDYVYKSTRAKYGAVVREIEEKRKKGQPILVGTTSIERNQVLSQLLKHKKVLHNVLNAKNHEKEAVILADAGKPGAVTVATNMAGRGVDIVLGGARPDRVEGESVEVYEKSKAYKEWEAQHDLVIKAGGLHVIGTERHESRRIDNQLRGRSGRQGDPGSSRFYLSLEDDLMRIFGGEQISGIMDRLNMPEDQPIENKLVSRVIEQAQSKVEGFHFDIRKNLVEYDDVANQQREIVYTLRRRVLGEENLNSEILKKLTEQIERIMLLSWPEDKSEPDWEKIMSEVIEIIPLDDASRGRVRGEIEKIKDKEKLKEGLIKLIGGAYEAREKQIGKDVMRQIEKFAYVGSIDHLWIDHIDYIDGLRESIRLRAYGQRDPLVEFKNEAFDLFERLLGRIDEELGRRIFRIGISQRPNEIPLEMARTNIDMKDATGLVSETGDEVAKKGQPLEKQKKLGRNDPCWCGSGKKWKHCHYPQLSM